MDAARGEEVIGFFDRSGDAEVDLDWLKRVAVAALPYCLAVVKGDDVPLKVLEEVEFTVLGDVEIAEVHERFMDIPGATDVITFHHGEVVMSVDTAREHAEDYGVSVGRELALYTVHGLLHLGGYTDKEVEDAEEMCTMQEAILGKVLKELE